MRRDYLLPILCLVVGMLLLVFSVAWQRLAKPDSDWTPEKGQELVEAANELQRLSEAPATADTDRAELAASKEYDRLLQERNAGPRGRVVVLGMLLQMTGMGIGLVGAIWLIMRQNQAADRRAASG